MNPTSASALRLRVSTDRLQILTSSVDPGRVVLRDASGREVEENLSLFSSTALLRGEGDNDTAEKVSAQLPDQIDTVRDSEALSAVGLDQATLQGKLAGGAIGGSMAM